MKGSYAPFVAALVLVGSLAFLSPGIAQLPPTNMGKYVHQPGDNQYSDATQRERHGSPAPVRAAAPVVVQGGYTPAPAPPKPDPTLDPIAADEPVPIAGFPPIPDRLDLPVAGGGGAWKTGGGGGGGYGGGGGGYGGGGFSGAAPGMAGGGGGGPPQPTFHQHYGHVPPGAFQQKQSQGYYKATSPPPPSGGGGSGYYKARSPGTDQYSNTTSGGQAPGMAPPAYTGASAKDFKSLGREPKLNDRQEQTQTPDAPTPVVVSQSTTQDLSLPEDEFSYRHPQRSAASQFGKSMGRMIKAPLNSIGGVAGVRF